MTALPPPGREVRITDPQVLRALAHPLRNRLLGLLRVEGPSTATRLGQRLGESSGATSYHLRQLAAYGLVGEAVPAQEGRGSGRERWWQAQHQMTSWESDELLAQPGGEEATELMQRMQIEHLGRHLRTWAQRSRELGPAWTAAAGLSDYVLRLTPEETRRLTDEVYAVLDRWSLDHSDPRPGTELVGVFTAVVPLLDPVPLGTPG